MNDAIDLYDQIYDDGHDDGRERGDETPTAGPVQSVHKTIDYDEAVLTTAPPVQSMFLQTSDDVDKLFNALAKASAEFEPVHFDAENTYYGSKYATLGAMINATRKALSKHGLFVLQTPLPPTDQEVTVVTRLCHGGQWVESALSLPAVKREKGGMRYDAHSIGSAITYARRYAYSSLLGLYADQDDDANAVVEPPSSAAKPTPKRKRNGDQETTTKTVAEKLRNGRRGEIEVSYESVHTMADLEDWWQRVTQYRRDYAKETGVAEQIKLWQEMKDRRKKELTALPGGDNGTD